MNTPLNPAVVPFDPSGQWPDPDMTVGGPTLPPAPVMTEDEFSLVFGPWSGWLKSAAEVKNAPVDYVAAALLTTVSAAIGNARWAVPWDGWKEPPVLWAMLVGDPSSNKSPALDSILDPVKEIETEMSEAYCAAREKWDAENEIAALALAQWRQEAKSAISEGSEAPTKPDAADAGSAPVRDRLRIIDATIEKVADLLSSTWRGLLLGRDELSGWLGAMDRYSGGGDRPFWLEPYGGRGYTIDRKNSPEPIIVDHLSIAILGGTQHDKLASLLTSCDDDGLLARFMVVAPDAAPLVRPQVALDDHKVIQAVKRLRSLLPASSETGQRRPFYINFTDDAANALQVFRERCRVWEGDASGIFKSHIGKMPGLVVRIANVLAHLDWAATENGEFVSEITLNHVGRACHFVGEYLRPHAFRAYGAAKPPPEFEAAKVVAGIIQSEGLTLFKLRDIQNRGRRGLSKTPEVKAALAVLEDANWLRQVNTGTGGRPSVFYVVNPRIGEAT